MSKDQHDDLVSFVPGSSVIDIGEIRKAQMNEESDLDEEANLIREEIENDLELKKDVLEGYEESASNDELSKIAESVALQTASEIANYEKLAMEVSEELMAHNVDLIKEDILLENSIKAASTDADDEVETEEMSEQDQELKAALPQKDENGEYSLDDLQSCISALLFYSEKPISLKKMKEMLEMPEVEDELLLKALNALRDEFTKTSHGFEIAEIAGGYQYRTKIARAPLLRKLAKVQVQRLSRGAMEALTIVAFKQPCTKDDIDQVRGVDSSHFIRTLLDRNLIQVTGRSEAAGRPMIYNTTDTFLEVFGMMDLTGLPSLSEIEAMVPQLAAQEEGQEDPRILQMRKMVHQMKEDSNHLDYNGRDDEQILQEIRDRVKAIDVTTPYLARQKELAEQGIQGSEAEEILSKEFGFSRDEAQDQNLNQPAAASLSVEETTEMNFVREALSQMDLDSNEEHSQ